MSIIALIGVVILLLCNIQRRKWAEARLQEAHDKLDFRIGERTRELQEANDRLSKEGAYRDKMTHDLKESELRFHQLSDAPFEGIVIHEGSKILDVNLSFAQMFGLDRESFRGKSLLQFFSMGFQETLARHIKRLDETPYELTCERSDGSLFPVEIKGRKIPYRGGEMQVTAVRDIARLKREESARELLILELRGALAEVKRLSGLLPICASCKKIRDDEGYWSQVEVYVTSHSEADFTHGLCPECAEKMYGDYQKRQGNS